MADQSSGDTTVNQQDVNRVSGKLQEFAGTLPEQEQMILAWLMSRAANGEDPEVSGYAAQFGQGAPFASQFTQALGLSGRAAAASTDSISWSHSFGKLGDFGGFQQFGRRL